MIQIEISQAGVKAVNDWTLMDGYRTLAVGNSREQLKEARLSTPLKAATPNTIVDLVSPQGDTLSIGIASPQDRDNPGMTETLACLNFTSESRNPPYLTVVGDSS